MIVNRWKVKEYMALRHIDTIKELSILANLTEKTVHDILKGGPFGSRALMALCEQLQCTPNDILEGYPVPVAPREREQDRTRQLV